MHSFRHVLLASAFAAAGLATFAQSAPAHWLTLGTAAGPVLTPERSQPANLLMFGSQHWLVDCGDGAVERLSAAKLQPPSVHAVFLSHLHLDHIAGLQGLLGLRWIQGARDPITVYGPSGTDEVVASIVHSLEHSVALEGGPQALPPAATVKVIIVHPGDDLVVHSVHVRAARNSHFDLAPGITNADGPVSLSYRFDLPDESIGYTGDTGVSSALAALFKGTDLIVSEVIDLPAIIASVNGPDSPMPLQMRPALIEHFKTQHLTPQQAAGMAQAAGAHRLVFTHLAITGRTEDAAPLLLKQAQQSFSGKIFVAHDLDSF